MAEDKLKTECIEHLGDQKYNEFRLLGSGSFCQVWNVCSSKTQENKAVKIIEVKQSKASASLTSTRSMPIEVNRTKKEFGAKIQERYQTFRLSYPNHRDQKVFPDVVPEMFAPVVLNKPKPTIPQKPYKASQIAVELEAAEALMKANHPNLVKVMEVQKTESYMYIFMERLSGGSLDEYLCNTSQRNQLIDESQVRLWTRQIADALKYMHTVMHRAHRDLKLDNILLDKAMNAKLVDFGFSCNIRQEIMCKSKKVHVERLRGSHCGTPAYIAPEVLMIRQSEYPDLDYEADIADMYSLGVCVFLLLSGVVPNSSHNLRAKAYETHTRAQVYSMFSDSAFDLICKLLKARPDKRPDVRQVLKHPFVSSSKDWACTIV